MSAKTHERRQLGDVVGQVVGEEPADVGERRPALLDGGDDGGEVVVEQHQVGGLAGDVGAADGPSRRRCRRPAAPGPSLTPSPVIATTWPRARSALRDAQLVLRRRPGRRRRRRGRAARRAPPRRRAGRAPSTTRLPSPRQQADLAGDRPPRWRRVVAGDHGDADAGPPARGERVGHAGARRVLQPDEARAAQVALGRRRRRRRSGTRDGRRGDGEHPQAAVAPSGRGLGRGPAVAGAAGEHGVRRALHRQHAVAPTPTSAAGAGRTGSAAAGGVPRRRPATPTRRARASRAASIGSPDRDPPAVVVPDRGRWSSAPRRGPGRAPRPARRPVRRRRRRSARSRPRGPWPLPAGVQHLDDGHLVAGQRAGLVGADERGRAERLDRLQAPDQGVARGQPLGAEGQRQGDGRQQALGDERDRDADGEQEAVAWRAARAAARRRRRRRPTPTAITAMIRTTRSSSRGQRRLGPRRPPGQRGDAGQPGVARRWPTTAAVASPSTTNVPACSASPGVLGTGTLSPVSVDSSTRRPCTSCSAQVGGRPGRRPRAARGRRRRGRRRRSRCRAPSRTHGHPVRQQVAQRLGGPVGPVLLDERERRR